MTNDMGNRLVDNLVPCFALSKKDSYLESISGGKTSLFNMTTFEVYTKLKGHQKQVIGLVFSNVRNVLVSLGSDAQHNWMAKAGKQVVADLSIHRHLILLLTSGFNFIKIRFIFLSSKNSISHI